MVLTILGFIFFTAIVLCLMTPLILVIKFPASASDISSVASTLIPWVSIILLLLVFNEGIKQVFSSISLAIDRIKKVSAGGATTEFVEQQRNVYSLTAEQLKQLADWSRNLEKAKQEETTWAWYYYVRFVFSTIYRSQVELLQKLNSDGPLSSGDLRVFYEAFLVRMPTAASYKFESYVQYLTSNFLVNLNDQVGKLEITEHGRLFLAKLQEAKVSLTSLPG